MNYEICKKLKDAGFLQGGNDCSLCYIEPNGDLKSDWNNSEDSAYIPTLSELIEACGGRFKTLTKDKKHRDWIVWHDDEYQSFTDSTPEEAVARLWLSLNKQ
jgi:hypothetical protein